MSSSPRRAALLSKETGEQHQAKHTRITTPLLPAQLRFQDAGSSRQSQGPKQEHDGDNYAIKRFWFSFYSRGFSSRVLRLSSGFQGSQHWSFEADCDVPVSMELFYCCRGLGLSNTTSCCPPARLPKTWSLAAQARLSSGRKRRHGGVLGRSAAVKTHQGLRHQAMSCFCSHQSWGINTSKRFWH